MLSEFLPLDKATELFELYSCHVNATLNGTKNDSIEDKTYEKLLELEDEILIWQKLQEDSPNDNKTILLEKMKKVKFAGIGDDQDDSKLVELMDFFLMISEGTRIERTGWIQMGILDSEKIAGHMFRMAVMAILFDEEV